MANYGRLLALHRLLLAQRAPVSTALIQERLNCSRATVMRMIAELRDISRDPLPYDRFTRGFAYQQPRELKHGLPYLGFSAAELHALLVIRHQLHQMQPGLLADLLAPLEQRLTQLLSPAELKVDELAKRIRLLTFPRNPITAANCFPQCAEAVLQRRRLTIRYRSRTRDERLEREISPHRLVLYRDNWYLDAWCHLREGTRRFAVDRISHANVLDSEALELPEDDVDQPFAPVFGIFSRAASETAVLRFSPMRARWVADETWPGQKASRFLDDGRYELCVAYGDPTELIMEILKHVPEVEVVAPDELREVIAQRLRAALNLFSRGS